MPASSCTLKTQTPLSVAFLQPELVSWAAANYHSLCGFRQHSLFSVTCRSRAQREPSGNNIKVSQGWFLLGLWGRVCPLLFQASGAPVSPAPGHIPLTFLPLSHKDPVIVPHHLITSAETRVPGFGRDVAGGVAAHHAPRGTGAQSLLLGKPVFPIRVLSQDDPLPHPAVDL